MIDKLNLTDIVKDGFQKYDDIYANIPANQKPETITAARTFRFVSPRKSYLAADKMFAHCTVEIYEQSKIPNFSDAFRADYNRGFVPDGGQQFQSDDRR